MKLVIAVTALLLASPASAAPDPAADTAELKRITQSILDSIAPGDKSKFTEFLAPDAIVVDENNAVLDKAALLDQLSPLPKGIIGTSEALDYRTTFSGDLAFATYLDQEQVDFYGQKIHTQFRMTDTWRRTPQGWRLIGEHIAAVLRDPPAATLPQDVLCGYGGKYQLTPEIVATIRCEGDHLVVERAGRKPAIYKPEVKDLFFSPGAPRSRRVFLRDAGGRITGFADRREGEDAIWKRID